MNAIAGALLCKMPGFENPKADYLTATKDTNNIQRTHFDTLRNCLH